MKVFIFALAGAALGCGGSPSHRSAVGPPFELTQPLVAAQGPLADAVRGRIALVDIWATWCAPCVEGLPIMTAFAQAHPAIVVAGVNAGESAADVRAVWDAVPRGYSTWLDPDFKFADAVGAQQLPRVLVLDGAGVVIYTGSDLKAAQGAAALAVVVAGSAAEADGPSVPE